MRFVAGLGLSPLVRNEAIFRWTEVQLPLAEAGGSHRTQGGEFLAAVLGQILSSGSFFRLEFGSEFTVAAAFESA